LLNLLAGSHVLGAVPRCGFALQSASDEVTETRVVWTCCKNNDRDLGPRTTWERRDGRFSTRTEFRPADLLLSGGRNGNRNLR
jgi:hypothetical protein